MFGLHETKKGSISSTSWSREAYQEKSLSRELGVKRTLAGLVQNPKMSQKDMEGDHG